MNEADRDNSPSTDDIQDLVRRAHTILTDIRTLRLDVLPQPRLIMLYERAAELRQALRLGARAAYRQQRFTRQHSRTRHAEDSAATAAQALSALRDFFPMLRTLRQKLAHDFALAERECDYRQFYAALAGHKQAIRALLSGLTEASPARTEARLLEIAAAVARLKEVRTRLHAALEAGFEPCYKIFDSIFDALERSDALASVNAAVNTALRGPAYHAVAASYAFDKEFYLAQLADAEGKTAAVPDAVKRYLTNNPDNRHNPNSFFNNRHYLARYPEVRRLRYNALEHFTRYGEALRYDPCPEFDTRFYLESNDDVLDDGISAFRHFLFHGLAEERPPSRTETDFFNARYLDAAAGRTMNVIFIGEPAEAEDAHAWAILREACAAREEAAVSTHDAPPTGALPEQADACVVHGASLRGADSGFRESFGQSAGTLVYFGAHPQEELAAVLEGGLAPLTKICALTNNYEAFIRWQESERPLTLHYAPFDDAALAASVAGALLERILLGEAFAPRSFVEAPPDAPAISVVSILYKKAGEMCAFLESLNRQDIAREYEVILVNDASPDDAARVVESWLEERRRARLLNRFMRVTILHNASNLGNCLSRNRGIEAARADVVLVADGDVVFTPSCLTEHCRAYRFGDCDAVIGVFHFDMRYELIFTWALACTLNPRIVRQKLRALASCKDGIFLPLDGIYNFVTRNVSFKKALCDGDCFDPAFSYTSASDSGYGGEDYELAARFYRAGRRVRFAESAVALHIRHQDNSYNSDKNIAKLRNWNRLIAKHPDLPLIDRQYYQWQTRDLLQKTRSRPDAPERMEAHARHAHGAHIVIKRSRPLNILSYAWHAAHQYELFKLDHAVTLVTGSGTSATNRWGYAHRPRPRNVRFMPLHDIDIRNFDFAILPFDENVLAPERCNGVVSPDWGDSFRTMLAFTRGMPRAAICHGTPQRHGDFLADGAPVPDNAEDLIPEEREALRELLKDVHVVCNSHQARDEWRFHHASVIWHGFSPYEFPPGRHEKACLTLPEQALAKRPLYRGKAHLDRALALLANVCAVDYSASPPPPPGYTAGGREWAVAKFQNYTRYIGEYALYLNPTVHSPMPRSRDEAMLTGTIPVTLRNHDADMFIRCGVNGFYGESGEELAEHAAWLMRHPAQREAIGGNARRTALDLFNLDRYLANWSELIAELTGEA